MKKLALLLLLPLAACATSQQTAGVENCDPRWPGYDVCKNGARHAALSHWQIATGRGGFLASPAQVSAASGNADPSP